MQDRSTDGPSMAGSGSQEIAATSLSARGRRTLPLSGIVALGLLLLAPTLGMGFYVDDHIHQLALRGDPALAPLEPWALYDFGSFEEWEAVEGAALTFPWWTSADWRARFLRPVTSLFLAAEHAAFGGRAVGYHLVSLALHGLLLVLVHGLYQGLGSSVRAARTGTLLFALCDSAALPVGWVANVNSLLVAVLGVGALRCVLPAGQEASARAARPVLGVGLALAAALSKEAGVVVPFLVGLALLRRAREHGGEASMVERSWGWTSLTLALGLPVLLVLGGYGTNSLFYATPWFEPARFLSNLALLLGAGVVSLAGPFPLDVVTLFPGARAGLMAGGLLVGPPLALWVGRRVWRAAGAKQLALGALLFLAAQAGAPPADRLLFVPAIGVAGLLGRFFESSSERPSPRRLARLATRALWLSATVGSGLWLLAQAAGMKASADHLRAAALATEVGEPGLGQRDLFVLQAESQMHAFALPSLWRLESTDHDLSFWLVQAGNRPLRWTRVDGGTFDLEILGAPFLCGVFERVYLTTEPAFRVGDRWRTPAFEVEARAVEDGHPTILRFHLPRPLEDPRSLFLAPRDGHLVALEPPAPGASLVLPTPERAGPYMP